MRINPLPTAPEMDQLKKIALACKECCHWVGWMERRPDLALQKVKELKAEIEKITGQEIMEYT